MHSIDRQLLFGVLALQMDFISAEQFAEACTVWASRKDKELGELLAERGWLQPQDVQDIDRLLTRKVERHGGDVSASLREAGGDPRVHASLTGIQDEGLRQPLGPTPPPQAVSLLATRGYTADSLGRYTLSHVHATGGIGRVWLAHDPTLRREVALKELRPDRLASAFIQSRFLREAQITGQLEHPGIVPIYELGNRPDDNAPFYTMRFVRGRTLAEEAAEFHRRRKRGEAGALELRKLLGAFVGVCNAIAYAHSRGVLHRDLKPQNVILGDFGEVMVLDWGLARVKDEPDTGPPPIDLAPNDGGAATRAGQALGTPGYMSPEQATGEHDQLGPATDVYGLGAILFHLLANRPPFVGPTPHEMLRQVIAEPARPVREVAADAPPALEAVCTKALAMKPQDRYESATALADELQRWLADEPVQAYRDPMSVRARRWMRGHRTLVTAAVVFLVCGVLALGGFAAMTVRQERETAQHLARTADFASQIVEAAEKAQGTAEQARAAIAKTGLGQVRELKKNDPSQGQLAVTLTRLLRFEATTKRLAGQLASAESNLVEAVSTLEPLLVRDPENSTYRSAAANCFFNLGGIQQRLGKRPDAANSYLRTIELSGKPERHDVGARFQKAVAASELSLVQFGWKPMDEVEKASREAAALLDDVAEDVRPEDGLLARLFQSAALNRAARCLCRLGRTSKALEALDESAAIMEGLTKNRWLGVNPHNHNVLHFRALCWLGRAEACAAIKGKAQEAVTAYGKAIELWSRLVAETSESATYRFNLADSLAERAYLHLTERNRSEAEKDLDTADKSLNLLAQGLRSSIEYHASRAQVAEIRTLLALDAKDSASAIRYLDVARSAYGELLKLDSHNRLAREALEALESRLHLTIPRP